jgi:hypothetical protein
MVLLGANLVVGVLLLADYTTEDGGSGKSNFNIQGDYPTILSKEVRAGQHEVIYLMGGEPTPVEMKMYSAGGQLLMVRTGHLNDLKVDFYCDATEKLKIELRRQDGKTDPCISGWFCGCGRPEKIWRRLGPPKEDAPPRGAPGLHNPEELKPGPFAREQTLSTQANGMPENDGTVYHHQDYSYPVEANKSYRIELTNSNGDAEIRILTPEGKRLAFERARNRVEINHKAVQDGKIEIRTVAVLTGANNKVTLKITPGS